MSENASPNEAQGSNQEQSTAASTNDAAGGAPGSDAAAASQDAAASSTAASSANMTSSTNEAANSSAATSEAGSSAVPESSAAEGANSTAASSPATSGAELSNLTAVSQRSATGHKSRTGGKETSKTGVKSTTGTKSTTGAKSTTEAPASSRRAKSTEGAASPSPSGAAASTGGKRQRGLKLGQLKLEEAKIGIIGAGKMADALVQGLIHYVKIQPKMIHLAAPSAKNLEHFKNYGCRVTKRNYDIFGRFDCDIIFLCFHGYVIKHCYKLGGSKPHPLTTNYIPHQRHPIYILSMVSGVSLPQIKACLLNPESANKYCLEIHRIMMNTAVGHGLGICAIDCEPDSKKLSAPIRQLLSRVSQLEYVPASQMDAACALGGSGLAFSFYFINALADGAFRMGLSRKQAIRFASKTAQCAAQTMLESGKHPSELRDTVSAPSGAAIYGIHVLEKNDVASGVTAAVEAAHKRAIDLATQETS